MAGKSDKRQKRHKLLIEKLKQDPFLTDSELAAYLNVSVPTIRLDRMHLNIPELRERMMELATDATLPDKSEKYGEIIDLKSGSSGISVMVTTKKMCFDERDMVRGCCLYSMAESLAMTIIDEPAALIGVANIKYKVLVTSDTRLVARGEVRVKRENSFIVWVKIYNDQVEVFSGKFILNKE
ncbi:MAG TPA: transcription factor FapR [Clostridia bacterium]|nr:transcription factor FapR [Clostridiaceae bacterium]HOA31825.1 transcription factor FapR [Clostridia bacterium]HPZ53385.1 transcription factor FapR [Clostridia bacterium]